MPGSAQPCVRSKRREKWRQSYTFGDKVIHLPTEAKHFIPALIPQHPALFTASCPQVNKRS